MTDQRDIIDDKQLIVARARLKQLFKPPADDSFADLLDQLGDLPSR